MLIHQINKYIYLYEYPDTLFNHDLHAYAQFKCVFCVFYVLVHVDQVFLEVYFERFFIVVVLNVVRQVVPLNTAVIMNESFVCLCVGKDWPQLVSVSCVSGVDVNCCLE